jgi:hypothetical protein
VDSTRCGTDGDSSLQVLSEDGERAMGTAPWRGPPRCPGPRLRWRIWKQRQRHERVEARGAGVGSVPELVDLRC